MFCDLMIFAYNYLLILLICGLAMKVADCEFEF